MPHHRTRIDVSFKHCDPAGIVFYPRYVEMVNDTVEHWFKYALHLDFDVLHRVRGIAIPVADLHCSFKSPSRLGETLEAALIVDNIGNRSMNLDVRLSSAANGAIRMVAKLIVVFVDMKTIQPTPIPPDLLDAIGAFTEPAPAGQPRSVSHHP